MTEAAFLYDQKLLEQCAGSNLAAAVSESSEDSHSFQDTIPEKPFQHDESCLLLFRQYAHHYGRLYDASDYNLDRTVSNEGKLKNSVNYRVGKKLRSFVNNAVFVYNHNKEMDITKQYHVTLNRFSDMDLDEVLTLQDVWKDHGRHLFEEQGVDLSKVWDETEDFDFFETWTGQSGVITRLSSRQTIYDVAADLAIGKGSMNKLNPKKQKRDEPLPDKTLNVPVDGQEDPFQTPEVNDPELDGSFLSIRRNHAHPKHKNIANDDLHEDEPAVDRDFNTYLNWATTDNPDGVAIVNPPFDQGTCGSCWAFAAAGSLEASASRRAAYQAYEDYRSRHARSGQNATIRPQAITEAQQVEHEAFKMLNLSIQELLDCDTTADQGCTGGNPLLSFYFIHRYGLASWEDYPYVGYEDTCNDEAVKKPVATVKSWGIISPNHENHMELVLRYIGPIAVGVNGADHKFLAYSGGIFDRAKCKQGANHALLITGYGQEDHGDGSVTKYWIARNSWGAGYGENGYVRIKRGDGRKGTPGVCGIARSPSVALGGILLLHQDRWPFNRLGLRGSVNDTDDYPFQSLCARFGYGPGSLCGKTADWIDYHKALSLGLLGGLFFVLALWPLTGDCRRRRRIRRMREQKRREDLEREQQKNGLHDEESSLLPGTGSNATTYGLSAS